VQGALRIGTAAFNAGDHRAAHEAWEEPWLALESGTADERLLHGLIQYAAATHHARLRNWSGARRLAASAAAYLSALDDGYREMNVAAVRTHLRRLAADPEFAERRRPLSLQHDGAALTPADLSFEQLASVATLLAEEYEAFDATVVDDAIRYARGELGDDDSPPEVTATRSRGFVGMLFDFADTRDGRAVVYDRLSRHVERRRSRERDVDGLFE
jgi:predicted metal-dependent hydrolase